MADAYVDVAAAELGAFAGAHSRAFLRRALGDREAVVPVASFGSASSVR